MEQIKKKWYGKANWLIIVLIVLILIVTLFQLIPKSEQIGSTEEAEEIIIGTWQNKSKLVGDLSSYIYQRYVFSKDSWNRYIATDGKTWKEYRVNGRVYNGYWLISKKKHKDTQGTYYVVKLSLGGQYIIESANKLTQIFGDGTRSTSYIKINDTDQY